MKKLSQKAEIRRHLESGKHLTQMGALHGFRCFRLASRINDLRRDGMDIKTEMVRTFSGKRIAEYSLDKLD